MCGISGVELAIILAAAIIILGPEKLPEMLRGIAKLSGQIRGIAGELQDVGREVAREIPKLPDIPKDLPRDFVKKALLDEPEGSAERARRRARPRDPAAEAEVDRIRARQRQRAEGENVALQERAARTFSDEAGASEAAVSERSDGPSVDGSEAAVAERSPPRRPRPAAGSVARASDAPSRPHPEDSATREETDEPAH